MPLNYFFLSFPILNFLIASVILVKKKLAAKAVDHIINILFCISEEQNDISEELAMTDQRTTSNEIEII